MRSDAQQSDQEEKEREKERDVETYIGSFSAIAEATNHREKSRTRLKKTRSKNLAEREDAADALVLEQNPSTLKMAFGVDYLLLWLVYPTHLPSHRMI